MVTLSVKMPTRRRHRREFLRRLGPRDLAGPYTDLHASTVVLVGGAPAACTLVEADLEGSRVWSLGTGTLPAYRGRGLAKLAKAVALHQASAAGAIHAYTSNDEVNAPMLAINTWLGYQACATQWAYLKAL
jgi:GNAT superfamily N-acetyltransferase